MATLEVLRRSGLPSIMGASRGGMTGRFSYACAYSSADKSTGLRNRGSWVQIPLGALLPSNYM